MAISLGRGYKTDKMKCLLFIIYLLMKIMCLLLIFVFILGDTMVAECGQVSSSELKVGWEENLLEVDSLNLHH